MTTIHELCILKYSKVTLFFHVTSWHYCCTPINIEPTSPFWVCWTLSKLLPNKLILETLNTMGFKHVNLLQLPFCSCSTFCSTTQQNFMHVGDHFVCASFLHAPFCKTTTLLNVAIEHVQHVAHGPLSCTLQTLLQHFNIFVAFVQPSFGHVIFVDIEGGCQRAMNMLC
jgi:hypothetical protein